MITRLRVKNYKSLRELDLPLGPLTILVGPNNSGKSNIIDTLLLLAEAVSEGAGALHARGGFSDLVWNGELKRSISIILEGQHILGQKRQKFIYEVNIVGGPRHFSVNKEQYTIFQGNEARRILELNPQGSSNIFDAQGQPRGSVPGVSEFSLRYANSAEQFPDVARFAAEVGGWRDYSFDMAKLRVLPRARRDLRLDSSGENFASVLHTIQMEYPERFNRLQEHLNAMVPEIKTILSPLTEQGQTSVRVTEDGLTIRVPIWALSDGTLHTLAILSALYAPDPPALMCFEEPENFVHPRVLSVLAEAFREASQHSQILITTHSPYLVDCFEPEELVIVEKRHGSTIARRASKQKGLAEALEVLGLGEAWYTGSIGGVP